MHQEIQRDPRYWKRANEFLPERWLVGSEDRLYPIKGAWRPFKHGPRKCIAQSLVMIEIAAVLALTLREFDITPMYDCVEGQMEAKGLKTVDGERVYQTEEGATHPVEHCPCKVSLRV